MAEPLLYARAGGPPDDWHGLKIFDTETGHEVRQVVEVDVTAGWALVNRLNTDGAAFLDPKTGRAAQVKIQGSFEIRRSTDG